ncbi:alpha-glucan family phosphorylase [Microbacter margulisiae]|uniref:Starch phosphorylase n=1 Tax=Microbacter margulisiae TaxID=1350067 RepID=A0A7W5H332_9PORP|nr:alpha-glucan family phosphorylase [Microbacter margulisiae]MBB3187997.1 starch phosphorylase [Microbacter margulisiae]
MKLQTSHVNQSNWKEIVVSSHLPDRLIKLKELAHNLWWVWNPEAFELFTDIDPKLWEATKGNPIVMREHLSYEKFEELEADQAFLQRLDKVYNDFQTYVNTPVDRTKPSIAYFSMEYGLCNILKIYSGGLGMLAGDYLKEASDCNVDMTAVGFLYRFGYFTQSLSMEGQQLALYEPQNFGNLPLEQVKDEHGNQLQIEVPYPNRIIYANVWKVAVGRVSLYLLDTDNDKNSEFDRPITHQLYGGDWENRLKQEIMLGIGGMLTLKKLGITKQVYHINEGHAALINLQRLVDLISEQGLTFNQAMEVVRSSALYTVHTPVPAGHDSFDEGLFGKYMGSYPAKLGISWDEFMDLGRENLGDHNEKFSMSNFACRMCQEVNGVSWLHGKVSQEMFQNLWKGYLPEELHVSYVTNGVHLSTWTASEWQRLYDKTFSSDFRKNQSNLKIWEGIYSVSDEEIWKTRTTLKNKLISYIKSQINETWLKNQGDPGMIVAMLEKINPNALMIGFGRRFATYKRAHLLFTDLDRLSKIVNNPLYPVQFIYTGKAHPADLAGQDLIRKIIQISRMPEFQGKIIFLENYDMQVAKRLISGVDIWLNTPTRPLEASGTSGQKAEMNGVLNFSVLDGWWLEGYIQGAGWALTEKQTYNNEAYQDQLDAATIYSLLENEIIPLYFAKNSKGYSPEWIEYIKNSIAKIAPRFTTKRMLDDYLDRFYFKLSTRHERMIADNFKKAKELVAWKEKMAASWDNIELRELNIPESLYTDSTVNSKHLINTVLDVKTADCKNIGIELVVTYHDDQKNEDHILDTAEFDLVKVDGTQLTFQLEYRLTKAGAFRYGFRMFPKNEELPHRQDFNFVRWL